MKPSKSRRRKERRKKSNQRPPPMIQKEDLSYDSDSSALSVESFSFIPWIYTTKWRRSGCTDQDLPPQTSTVKSKPSDSALQPQPKPKPIPKPISQETDITDEDIDVNTIPLFTKIINDIKDEDDLNTLTLMLSLEPTISKLNSEIDSHAIVGAASIIISYCGVNAFKSTSSAAKQSQAEAKQAEEPSVTPLPEPPKTKFHHTPILSTTPITWPGFTDSPAEVSIPTIAVHPPPFQPQPNNAIPPSIPTTAVSTFVPHVRPQMYPTYQNHHMRMNGQMMNSVYSGNTVNTLDHRNVNYGPMNVQPCYYNNYNQNITTINAIISDYIYAS